MSTACRGPGRPANPPEQLLDGG